MLLVTMVLISIVLRYPLVDHERCQADSYFIHTLSRHIVDDQRALWTLHPLSYLGYYPLSYPSGVPFVLSETSLLTGLSIEASVLLLGVLLGILFTLVAFLLSREFVSQAEFILLATLFATLGPRFVDTTYWVGSARGPLIVLMALTVLVFYRSYSTGQSRRYLFVGAFLFFGCLASHHMAVLFVVFAMGYVLAVLSSYVAKTYGDSISRRTTAASIFLGTFVTLLMVVSLGYLDFFLSSIERSFSTESNLFNLDSKVVSTILNLGVSYTHQVGLIIVFAAAAIPFAVKSLNMTVKNIYPLTVVLCFLPLIGSSLYISMVLLPFLAIIGATWFRNRMKSGRSRKGILTLLLLLIVFSLVIPAWSTIWWNSHEYRAGTTVEVDNRVFNDVIYLRGVAWNRCGVSNTELLQSLLGAESGVEFVNSGIQSAMSGEITRTEIEANMSWSESNFPVNLYLWFEYEPDINMYYAYRGLMTEGVGFIYGSGSLNEYARGFFLEHSRLVVVVDNHWPSSFVGRWGTQEAAFPSELSNAQWSLATPDGIVGRPLDSYRMYESEGISIFLTELPV